MTLLAITWWTARAWYLRMVLARIARIAPMHPERLQVEREVYECERRLRHLHRRLTSA